MSRKNKQNCAPTSEVPHSRGERASFSQNQVGLYMRYIGIPDRLVKSSLMEDGHVFQEEERSLHFLTTLMRHHVAKIPFENTFLHYSQHKYATLDLVELFERMVESESGRGGYCFQHNALFGTMLRSLGFDVIASAARVSTACEAVSATPNYAGHTFNSWNHMINIVSIASKDYLVDVGMGSWSPVVPVELSEGDKGVTIAPRTMRLVRGCIPEYTSCRSANDLWQYEVRNSVGGVWIPVYSFSELEFLPVDFDALNWYVSTNPRSWFTSQLVCNKLVLNDAADEVVGDITLYQNTIRKRVHAKSILEKELKSEKERVDALRGYFGVHLSRQEQSAILRTPCQIP